MPRIYNKFARAKRYHVALLQRLSLMFWPRSINPNREVAIDQFLHPAVGLQPLQRAV